MVTTRTGKGSPLTWTEVDNNFTALEASAESLAISKADINAYDRANHTGADNPNLNEQFGDYTLTLTDANPQTVIRMNSATDNTVTLPPYASVALPIGTRIPVDQWGDGQTTITPGTGVVLRTSASTQVKAKYSRVYLEKQGTDEWLLTGDIAVGGPVGSAPVCTIPPSISGTAVSGQTLTAAPGTWTGTPTPTITGQWYANAVAIVGETNATYATANPGDDGKAITYRESAVNTAGGPTQATSNSITMTPAAATKPVSTGVLPVISGSAVVGGTLTCTSGGWTNSPTTHKYVWKDGTTTLEDTGQLTPGTSDTYVVLVGQTGRTITCQVTAHNAAGDTEVPVTSAGYPIAAGPTATTRTVLTTGVTLRIVFSSAVNAGAGGFTTGMSVSASGGAVTATYASGTGTTTLNYTLSRTVNQGETVSLSYTQPAALNGIKSSTTGAYVASFVGLTVTNNSTQAPAISWEGPITISTGGTHNITNRNIRSTNASTPAISIQADSTVNITNCRIESMHRGIVTYNAVNLTVQNCTYKAVNPNVNGQNLGYFISMQAGNGSNSLIIENNTMKYGGVYIVDGSCASFRFRYNKAIDIEGRYSDGAGGLQTETGPQAGQGYEPRQMIQFDAVSIPGADISWNEMINDPANSRVEDAVSIYATSGTSGSPISIANNFFWGGFSSQPYTINYSGTGILTELGSSYININDNVVVAYTNCGIGCNDPTGVNVDGNRFICSGKLNATTLWAPNRAGYFTGTGSDNSYTNNEFSWMGRDTGGSGALSNRGLYNPDGLVTDSSSTQLANATEASEAAEKTTWESKKTSNGVTTGSDIALW